MGIEHLQQNDRTRHRRLIKRLNEAADPASLAIAEILSGCTPESPCRSGACPVCARAFQHMTFDLITRVIRKPARAVRDRMTAFTLIPEVGCVHPDDLSVEVCHEVAAEISKALKAARIAPAVGGLDISFNEDDDGKIAPHWCAHGHLAGIEWASDAQIKILNKAISASPLVKRPVHAPILDLKANGRHYVVKPESVRRVGYLDNGRPKRRPCRNTHRRELRAWQSVILAKVEHELDFRHRLITHEIASDAVEAAFDGFYWPQDGP